MKFAFKDAGDGYYEVDVADETSLPEWTKRLTPCLVQPVIQTPAQIEASITAEVQRRLDAWAQQREYDGIVSLCSYAGDPDPMLNTEGALGKTKRSETWVAMKRIRADVQSGNWPTPGAGQLPQSIADIEADLPPLVWPA